MSSIRQRKLDHLKSVLEDPNVDRQGHWFDAYRLTHHALPELDLADIDSRCHFLGKPLSSPLLIASMTGGDHPEIIQINQRLATAAEACGVAMSVGSQRIQFEHPASAESFRLRPFAPSVPLIANIGAIQLNYGFDHTHLQTAIDTLGADAIFLHLNPLQEAIQPEGNTRFSGLWDKIEQMTQRIQHPILLKEVGSGLSAQLIQQGMNRGIQGFDLAGSGGTSWSKIEQNRQTQHQSGLTFQDWGIPTPMILEQCQAFAQQTTLIASGGVRNGVDVVKSIILGAKLAGMAAPLLQPAMISTQAVIDQLEQIKRDIRIAMFLLGVQNINELWNNRTLLSRQ